MKKYCFFIFLFSVLRANAQFSPENNNTTNSNIKHTAMYVLKYYYPEEPEKVLFKRAYRRMLEKDQSFCIVDYDPEHHDIQTYRSCFDRNGVPTALGDEQIFRDSIRLSFKGKDTTILINTVKELKDPTVLWFWKLKPRLNDTVIVGSIRKNFITKSVNIVRVAFIYLGNEDLNVLGQMKTCNVVRSVPLNGSDGVYDERWFDQNGMLVKEKHVVGKSGTRIGELIEIIE